MLFFNLPLIYSKFPRFAKTSYNGIEEEPIIDKELQIYVIGLYDLMSSNMR
jgi:hypothetical protein